LHFVQARAASGGVRNAVDAEAVMRRVNDALPRGWVDYRKSFPAAKRVQSLLDELADLLEAGAADVVRPALERVVTRLQKLRADDSGGVLGDACQRAAELHAEACCAGSVDGRKLGRWLAKFRLESPGWPLVTLEMYAPALAIDGIASYRAAAAKASVARKDASFFDRFEIDRMLVELADHDGDLDTAIEILSHDAEHTSYGAIIDRLDAAGRSADALSWTDRAVAKGKLATPWSGANEFWLSPRDVTSRYRRAGRNDDALAVARSYFRAHIGVDTLKLLVEVGAVASTSDAEREWAMHIARADAARRQDGAALVQLALAADDLPGAWSAAEQFGAGAVWRSLAEASYADLPVAAADLYRPELERLLAFADTSRYREIAEILRTMRELYGRVGEAATIDAEIAAIREKYRRRTSLIAQLDRARLP
jgi:hypothetical protein